jgi:hypothetical protein
MNDRNIDPKNPESESDVITCEMMDVLRTATTNYIDTLKKKGEAFTNDQFQGIYNATLNYFHQTLDLLIHCIAGKEDKSSFLNDIDANFHHILNHLLDDLNEPCTNH